jgi:hypothetical protein
MKDSVHAWVRMCRRDAATLCCCERKRQKRMLPFTIPLVRCTFDMTDSSQAMREMPPSPSHMTRMPRRSCSHLRATMKSISFSSCLRSSMYRSWAPRLSFQSHSRRFEFWRSSRTSGQELMASLVMLWSELVRRASNWQLGQSWFWCGRKAGRESYSGGGGWSRLQTKEKVLQETLPP